jgi:hypothetical protein
MRTFWIILLLVTLIGGGYVFFAPAPTKASPRGTLQSQAQSVAPLREVPPPSSAPSSPLSSSPSPPKSSAPADSTAREQETATQQSPVFAEASSSTAPTAPASPISLATSAKETDAAAPTSSPSSLATSTPGTSANEAVATATSTAPAKAASNGAAPSGDAAQMPAIETLGGYGVLPPSAERKPDGSILLDGKFLVKGEGTLENPYQVTWELLTSVDAEFDPHAGKKKLPYRIAMLHDKYIKLGGFIAFPMNMQQPKELLLMLNQWDGCCIGVPPTPYDAIEVTLDTMVEGEDRFATNGSLIGKFQVKPYVVGDWLVGLYVMDRGGLKVGFGGGSGT